MKAENFKNMLKKEKYINLKIIFKESFPISLDDLCNVDRIEVLIT